MIKTNMGNIPGRVDLENDLFNFSLEDLLIDECEQIIISDELFMAFDKRSKGKKYYSKKIYSLFKYVVYLYNDTNDWTNQFGALTYLTKISNVLDYLEISSIMELSIDQINMILDLENGEDIQKKYTAIVNRRHKLTNEEFRIYIEMLKNNTFSKVNKKDAKKAYEYISNIYNNNPILQDNVGYLEFLDTFAKVDLKSITSLRMFQILDMFNIDNINYDNVNESKMLVNDLTKLGLNTL